MKVEIIARTSFAEGFVSDLARAGYEVSIHSPSREFELVGIDEIAVRVMEAVDAVAVQVLAAVIIQKIRRRFKGSERPKSVVIYGPLGQVLKRLDIDGESSGDPEERGEDVP